MSYETEGDAIPGDPRHRLKADAGARMSRKNARVQKRIARATEAQAKALKRRSSGKKL